MPYIKTATYQLFILCNSLAIFIVVNVSYEVACDKLNLSTLADRRASICSTLLRQITCESHVLHYLLPAQRDAEIASRLRSTNKYPTVHVRTSWYKNSFIPYALSNYQWQWRFHPCFFPYFYCMNVSMLLIQPPGCHNPINVVVVVVVVAFSGCYNLLNIFSNCLHHTLFVRAETHDRMSIR